MYNTKSEKKVAILQPNYVPWRGYFDLIQHCDLLILFDHAQYTTSDWRNRNLVKTPTGLSWMTIPVGKAIHRTIAEVTIADPRWQRTHWNTLESNYRRAIHAEWAFDWLRSIYRGREYATLSDVNHSLIREICKKLQIHVPIISSLELGISNKKEHPSDHVLNMCLEVGASVYISGGAGRNYLRERDFWEHGISLKWFEYSKYPEYQQLWGEYQEKVSILDLFFNCGPNSLDYLSGTYNS